MEPPECLSARLGSLASAERGQAGGGEEQGENDDDGDDDVGGGDDGDDGGDGDDDGVHSDVHVASWIQLPVAPRL